MELINYYNDVLISLKYSFLNNFYIFAGITIKNNSMKRAILILVFTQMLSAALKAQTNSPNAAVQKTATDYFKAGLDKGHKKDYKGAIEQLTKAIEIDVNNTVYYNTDRMDNKALVYNYRASYKKDLKDFKGAIEDYKKAMELAKLKETERDIYLNDYKQIFYLKRDLGEYKEAIEVLNNLITEDPNQAYNYDDRGDMKLKTGDNAGACNDWAKAFELDPKEIYGSYGNKPKDKISKNCNK